MSDQEHHEDDNPLVEFPRKPGHALRGDGWAWLDDEPAPRYKYAPDRSVVLTRIMLRIGDRRDERNMNDG